MRVSPRPSLEREIKLSVPVGFSLPAGLGEVLPARTLVSTYVDTPDYCLAKHGITFRRRLEQRRGLWQLKLPSGAGRLEVELEEGGAAPPQALSDLLYAHLRGETLRPVAKLRTRRVGVRVRNGGAVAEVVLDRVSVLQERRVQQHFLECEIELLEGDPALLGTLEAELRRAGAGDHDGRPKLFRVLGLPAWAPPPMPPADAPLREHVKAALLTQVVSMLTVDPRVRLGADSEAVHQMRVAIRRLRAMLRALRPIASSDWAESLRAELAWLGGLLGAARDLDVQIEHFRGEVAALDAKDRGPVKRLVRVLERERRQAQDALLTQLRSERYLALLDQLQERCAEPAVVETALSLRDLAGKEFRRLRRSVHELAETPSDQNLHRLRIRAKRSRYAAELAAGTVGKPAWRFVEALKELQDVLGAHQDAVVAEDRVRSFLGRSQSVHAAFAAGRMVERQRQRRADARAQWRGLWKKVAKRGKRAWR